VKRESKNPKVSIVIPSYNCARFLGEAVQSALRQTYRPLEVIVLDDGSTDDTRDVLKPFEDGIRYIYQDNGGLAAARNAGIAAAAGELTALLDADDTCHPERIERQVELLVRRSDVGFVATAARLTDIDGHPTGRTWGPRVVPGGDENGAVPGESLEDIPGAYLLGERALLDYLRMGFFAPATIMIRREVFLKCGGYEVSLRQCQDYELMSRLLYVTRMGYLSEPLYFYRKGRAGAATEKHAGICSWMIRALEFIEQSPIMEKKEYRDLVRKRIAGKHTMLAAYRIWDGDVKSAVSHLRTAASKCPRPVPLACLALAHAGPFGRPLLRRLARRILQEEDLSSADERTL